MKAISIKQPYAYLIASGKKTIETRTWKTDYRGPLLICASKSIHKGYLVFECEGIVTGMPTKIFQPFLEERKEPLSRTGLALCTVTLLDCRPMTEDDQLAAWCETYPDAWSWVLGDARPLAEPFPVSGKLNLFNVELPENYPDLTTVNHTAQTIQTK